MTPGPKRLIEPEEKQLKLPRNKLDFSHWERRYGRELSESERVEIRENSIALLKVLISEHHKELTKNG